MKKNIINRNTKRMWNLNFICFILLFFWEMQGYATHLFDSTTKSCKVLLGITLRPEVFPFSLIYPQYSVLPGRSSTHLDRDYNLELWAILTPLYKIFDSEVGAPLLPKNIGIEALKVQEGELSKNKKKMENLDVPVDSVVNGTLPRELFIETTIIPDDADQQLLSKNRHLFSEGTFNGPELIRTFSYIAFHRKFRRLIAGAVKDTRALINVFLLESFESARLELHYRFLLIQEMNKNNAGLQSDLYQISEKLDFLNLKIETLENQIENMLLNDEVMKAANVRSTAPKMTPLENSIKINSLINLYSYLLVVFNFSDLKAPQIGVDIYQSFGRMRNVHQEVERFDWQFSQGVEPFDQVAHNHLLTNGNSIPKVRELVLKMRKLFFENFEKSSEENRLGTLKSTQKYEFNRVLMRVLDEIVLISKDVELKDIKSNLTDQEFIDYVFERLNSKIPQ